MNAVVTLFERLTFGVQIEVIPGKQSWVGKHVPIEAVEGIGHPDSEISITYANEQWYINGLNVQKEWDDLMLAKALIDVSTKDPKKDCGKLVDLIFDQIIRTKFAFDLNFRFEKGDDGAQNGGIIASIGVKVRIMLARTGLSLDEIELPKFEVRLIFKIKDAGQLFEWLRTVAESLLEQIANWIFDHPDQFKKLIGWMLAKEWSKALINALLCREIDPENVKERHRELENPPESQPPWFSPQPPPQVEDHCVCTGEGWQRALCNLGQGFRTNGGGVGF